MFIHFYSHEGHYIAQQLTFQFRRIILRLGHYLDRRRIWVVGQISGPYQGLYKKVLFSQQDVRNRKGGQCKSNTPGAKKGGKSIWCFFRRPPHFEAKEKSFATTGPVRNLWPKCHFDRVKFTAHIFQSNPIRAYRIATVWVQKSEWTECFRIFFTH